MTNQTKKVKQSEESKNPRTLLSRERIPDTLLVVIAPALAYLFAFTYEAGFAAEFNIPLTLISLSINTILVVTAATIGVFISIVLYTNFLSMFVLNFAVAPPINRRVIRLTPPFIAWLGFSLVYGFKELWWLPLIFAFILLLEFVLPIVKHRHIEGYLAKLDAEDEAEAQVPWPSSLIDRAIDSIGRNATFGLMFIAFVFLLTSASGHAAAQQQKEFLVSQQNPQLIVLRIYGDNIVCGTLAKNTRNLTTKVTIIKTGSPLGSNFLLRKIGPLKPMKVK